MYPICQILDCEKGSLEQSRIGVRPLGIILGSRIQRYRVIPMTIISARAFGHKVILSYGHEVTDLGRNAPKRVIPVPFHVTMAEAPSCFVKCHEELLYLVSSASASGP